MGKYVTWCYVILLHIFGSPSFRVQTGTPGGGSVPRKVWRSFYLNQPKVGIIIQKCHEIEMPIHVPRSITDTTVTTLSALCHLFINLSQASEVWLDQTRLKTLSTNGLATRIIAFLVISSWPSISTLTFWATLLMFYPLHLHPQLHQSSHPNHHHYYLYQ